MAKGTISFSLPEEEKDFIRATKALGYALVLWDLDQFLRSKVKHGNYAEDVEKAYQDARDQLGELMSEYKVEFPE